MIDDINAEDAIFLDKILADYPNTHPNARADWWGQYPPDGMTLASVSLSDEPYRFDIVQVRKDYDDGLWISHDSGCSCPSPWERHTQGDWEILTVVTAARMTQNCSDPDKRQRFLLQVRDLLG